MSVENTKLAADIQAQMPVQAAGGLSPAHRRSWINITVAGDNWPWLLATALSMVDGLLGVVLGIALARQGSTWAEPLFWFGLLFMLTPVAAGVLSDRSTNAERLALILFFGLALYAVKVMEAPLTFTFHDEFLHWRTANDILTTNHLFQLNPLLPVSSLYPGLEIATSALAKLSGLSLYTSGLVLLAVARLIGVLGLYLLFGLVSRSERIGGLATLLYMANPNFVFFDAQFSYETLALPLAVLLLFAVSRREDLGKGPRTGYTAAYLLLLGAVVATHHLTSYIFAGFLVVWSLISLDSVLGLELGHTAVEFIQWYGASSGRRLARIMAPRLDRLKMMSRRELGDRVKSTPAGFAVVAALAAIGWLVLAAHGEVVNYLMPHLQEALSEILGVISNQAGAGRGLFESSSGQVSPLWERITGMAAAALTLIGLPIGTLAVWQRYRSRALVLTLAGIGLAYPLSLGLRLTASGWEAGNRSSEFVFLGVAFLLAVAIAKYWQMLQRPWVRPALIGCVAVLFTGGVIAGFPPTWRLPGPYLAGGGPRSIEQEGISAAEWARMYLGPDNRIVTDPVNELLLGSYGEQRVVNSLSGGVDAGWILYAPTLGDDQLRTLREYHIRYLVVDERLRTFSKVPTAYFPSIPMDVALEKFDHARNVSRVFDSGSIVIYDMEAISNAP